MYNPTREVNHKVLVYYIWYSDTYAPSSKIRLFGLPELFHHRNKVNKDNLSHPRVDQENKQSLIRTQIIDFLPKKDLHMILSINFSFITHYPLNISKALVTSIYLTHRSLPLNSTYSLAAINRCDVTRRRIYKWAAVPTGWKIL